MDDQEYLLAVLWQIINNLIPTALTALSFPIITSNILLSEVRTVRQSVLTHWCSGRGGGRSARSGWCGWCGCGQVWATDITTCFCVQQRKDCNIYTLEVSNTITSLDAVLQREKKFSYARLVNFPVV